MIASLPVPEYRPDLNEGSGVLTRCENVHVGIDGSYRPIPAISAFSSALDEAFLGGYSAISSDGTGFLLAGTATDLYRYTSGTWTSLVGSLAITSRWQFAAFGDYVVAVNGAATREVDLSAGTDSAIAGAPSGTCIWVVGDYLCIGQADDEINKIATSAFRDHTGWTPGTNQSTSLSFQTGGAVQGAIGGEYGVILQRNRIVRQTRTGDAAAPFQYDEISSNFGCSNGATIAAAGRTVFFHSDRGFMAIEDGQALKPIGSEKIDRSFELEVGRDNFDNIYAAVDPQNKLVMWGVPGRPGKIWIYNFEQDKWTTAVMTFTGIMPGFTSSTTLEALAATYTDLDAMTISLDDGRWAGGNPQLYLFDGDYKAGTLSGDSLPAEFWYGFEQLGSGRSRIRGVRPITDATANITVSFETRQQLGGASIIKSTTSMLASSFMPVRASGRYIAPRVSYDAAADWSYLRGLEVEYFEAGTR